VLVALFVHVEIRTLGNLMDECPPFPDHSRKQLAGSHRAATLGTDGTTFWLQKRDVTRYRRFCVSHVYADLNEHDPGHGPRSWSMCVRCARVITSGCIRLGLHWSRTQCIISTQNAEKIVQIPGCENAGLSQPRALYPGIRNHLRRQQVLEFRLYVDYTGKSVVYIRSPTTFSSSFPQLTTRRLGFGTTHSVPALLNILIMSIVLHQVHTTKT